MTELATDKRQAGYIRLYRSLLDHPLITQLPAAWFRVYVVILLKANWKPGVWWNGHKEVVIPPGSFVTSVDKLRRMAKVSVMQTRSCLKYLLATNAIAIETAKQYTVITIRNWDSYQGSESLDNKSNTEADSELVTNQQQTDSKPITTIKEFNHLSIEEKPLIDYSPDFAKTAKSSELNGQLFSEPQSPPNLKDGLTAFATGSRFLALPPPQKIVAAVTKALGKERVDGFLTHLNQTQTRYRPGGKAEPRAWGWFIEAAANYANAQRAGSAKAASTYQVNGRPQYDANGNVRPIPGGIRSISEEPYFSAGEEA